MEYFDINQMRGFRIGSAQDEEAMTGVTVVICEDGAKGGIDISGGGPASRETQLLTPLTADNPINAVVLAGGSAFGLAAADGVMRYLEARGVGYDTGFARVPLVAQSCIYDLGIGRADVRPDAQMGYDACVDAERRAQVSGSVGAGAGATIGKMRGMEHAQKSGLGLSAVRIGTLEVGAVCVVNALGDVFDPESGAKIAGMRGGNCEEDLYARIAPTDLFAGNTTIACVITNARLDKAGCSKAASMARAAYARCISPVGTMADGDTIYTLASGAVEADVNVVGTLAARALARAIMDAVKQAERKG
ncbi:MAG: P1 family peptidase [Christensenellales bacterium]|jgi:L-aminopeptidase/D-esterase-like protein